MFYKKFELIIQNDLTNKKFYLGNLEELTLQIIGFAQPSKLLSIVSNLYNSNKIKVEKLLTNTISKKSKHNAQKFNLRKKLLISILILVLLLILGFFIYPSFITQYSYNKPKL